jgi:hypothetical protein
MQFVHVIWLPESTLKLPPQENSRIRLQERKLITENYPADQFLRKAHKCFGVCIVN